jgi:bifunctional non-homologous end joining protein LigD
MAERARLPVPVAPMLATLGSPPAAGAGFAFELKWDGARTIAVARGGELQLFSRNQRPIARSYPERVADLPALVRGRDIMLDGEIVALEPTGRPRFGLLQERLHVHAPPASLVARVPVIFYVFDILALDGEPTISLSYLRRRALLNTLGLASEHVRVPPHWEDVAGDAMLDVAREHGLEGILKTGFLVDRLPSTSTIGGSSGLRLVEHGFGEHRLHDEAVFGQ